MMMTHVAETKAAPAPAPAPASETCYVCLCEGTDLLSPCSCSWLFVHRTCLHEMITASTERCSICKESWKHVTTVTEQVRSVRWSPSLLIGSLSVGSAIALLFSIYMTKLLVVDGDEDAAIALALLFVVGAACGVAAYVSSRGVPLVRVETLTRAVVIG